MAAHNGAAPTSLRVDTCATCTWCTDHLGDQAMGMHQRHLGAIGSHLQVVLERQDHNGAAGRPNLSIRFSAHGDVADDAVDLPLDSLLAMISVQSTTTQRRDL